MHDESGESIVDLFKEGDLVFANPQSTKDRPTDTDILQADKDGLLVGTQGYATVFANCTTCNWRGHGHFIIGDDERDIAYERLEKTHDKQCKMTLKFDERQR